MGCVPPPKCRVQTVLSSAVATHSIPHGKLHPNIRTHATSPQINRGTQKINR